jgi:anti-anti-sigma factor
MKRRGDSSTSTIEIAVDHSGADAIVRLKGRVNVDSSPDVRDRLRAILSGDPLPHAVTMDLSDVTSIEASGIATLIEALKVARTVDLTPITSSADVWKSSRRLTTKVESRLWCRSPPR